jgi:hypothetical protein
VIDTSKNVGLEVNTEKINNLLKPPHQNARQTRKVCGGSFENVSKFKYVGTIVANQTLIHAEIKSRLNSRNGWCR